MILSLHLESSDFWLDVVVMSISVSSVLALR